MGKRTTIVLFVLIGLSLISSGLAYSNTLNLKNNKEFSEVSQKISNSTVLVMVKVDSYTINDKVSGAVYVDDMGVSWGTGTAFSIGDGMFLSASHNLGGEKNLSKVKLVWNGKEYENAVKAAFDDPNADVVILKTNLSIPSVTFVKEEMVSSGAKVGLIGYPLGEKTQILHDGIVSSARKEANGIFWYTINSFVNRGNSGGPVFLSDTGEVIGIVSSKQYENIAVPQIDESKLTDGEKELLKFQMFISAQLMVNSQVGIGKIMGINQKIIDNIKTQFKN